MTDRSGGLQVTVGYGRWILLWIFSMIALAAVITCTFAIPAAEGSGQSHVPAVIAGLVLAYGLSFAWCNQIQCNWFIRGEIPHRITMSKEHGVVVSVPLTFCDCMLCCRFPLLPIVWREKMRIPLENVRDIGVYGQTVKYMIDEQTSNVDGGGGRLAVQYNGPVGWKVHSPVGARLPGFGDWFRAGFLGLLCMLCTGGKPPSAKVCLLLAAHVATEKEAVPLSQKIWLPSQFPALFTHGKEMEAWLKQAQGDSIGAEAAEQGILPITSFGNSQLDVDAP